MPDRLSVEIDLEEVVKRAEDEVVKQLVKRALDKTWSLERAIEQRAYTDVRAEVEKKAREYVTEELVERVAHYYMVHMTEAWVEERLKPLVQFTVESFLSARDDE